MILKDNSQLSEKSMHLTSTNMTSCTLTRILFTMYRSTTSHSPAIVTNAKKIWRDNVLTMKIPHSTIFSRSYDEKKPISFLEPRHQGAIAYDVFAEWLIDYEKITTV